MPISRAFLWKGGTPGTRFPARSCAMWSAEPCQMRRAWHDSLSLGARLRDASLEVRASESRANVTLALISFLPRLKLGDRTWPPWAGPASPLAGPA